MSSKVDTIQEKLIPGVMKFANSKIIMAIKDGVILAMPFTVIGSLFLLIQNLPIPNHGWDKFMASTFGPNWGLPFNQVNGATFKILAIIFVFGIASQYAKNEGCDPVSSGILGIVCFIILSPQYLALDKGFAVGSAKLKEATHFTVDSGVLPLDWMSSKGLIMAIFVGLIAGYVYTIFIKRDIVIHMPESVPQGVANAFSALIPAAVLICGCFVLFILFHLATAATASEWVYKVLQIPMQGITDSFGGAIAIPFIICFFWWFGVHGATLIGGVMSAIYQADCQSNQALLDKGVKLITSGAGKNAHIVAQQFQDNFITMTGSGITIGLVLAMVLFGKSQRFKTLGKLALVPGLFNINEPILFGLPIVLNPFMFVPFILVPVIAGILTYVSIYVGLVPPFSNVQAPWTTPPIISGFLVAGWRGALLQIVILLIATVIYLPFFKAQDRIYAKEEQESVETDDGVNM